MCMNWNFPKVSQRSCSIPEWCGGHRACHSDPTGFNTILQLKNVVCIAILLQLQHEYLFFILEECPWELGLLVKLRNSTLLLSSCCLWSLTSYGRGRVLHPCLRLGDFCDVGTLFSLSFPLGSPVFLRHWVDPMFVMGCLCQTHEHAVKKFSVGLNLKWRITKSNRKAIRLLKK